MYQTRYRHDSDTKWANAERNFRSLKILLASTAENTSKVKEKEDERTNGKIAGVFRKVMESIQDLLEVNKAERAKVVLEQSSSSELNPWI